MHGGGSDEEFYAKLSADKREGLARLAKVKPEWKMLKTVVK